MPPSALGPLNPFAAELRRAAAGAAAPDKAPSLRELSMISGVGRSAIGDWLAGKSLPRSWDDGAVLVVDAIIKLAARYGKRFPDEDAVRQRCKDAYCSAKSAQSVDDTADSRTSVPGVAAAVSSPQVAPRYGADEGSAESPESGSAVALTGGWRARHTVWAVLALVILAGTVLLWWPAGKVATPLISMKSQKCVSVDGDADEARAFQLGCTPEPGRSWYLQPAVDEGTTTLLFRIVNPANGKCLSYSEKMFGGAHAVVQRSCSSGPDKGQLWSFVKNGGRGDDWVSGTFVNMHNSLLLDVNGENVDEGTPIVLWQENGKTNQYFRVKSEAVG